MIKQSVLILTVHTDDNAGCTHIDGTHWW